MKRLAGEDAAPLFAFGSAFAIMGAQVAARATRDAIFLSTFAVETLPAMMLASAALSLGSAVLLSAGLGRRSPARLIPLAFGASAVLFLGEWVLLGPAPRAAAVLLYLHPGALGVALLSGFWSVLNERFDPYTGKTVLARAGAFAALGGVFGGLAAERIGVLFGLPAVLGLLAALHVICALSVRAVGGAQSAGPGTPAFEASADSALAVLRRVPLLRAMALLMLVLAVMNALVEYAFKASAAQTFGDGPSLIRFFALFEVAVSGLAFLLQAAVAGPLLRRFGLAWAIALRPISVFFAALLGVLLARFWTVALARAADLVSTASTFSTGFELLYTPLTAEQKRPTKAYIDIGATRVGEMAGAAMVLTSLWFAPALSLGWVLAAAGVAAGAAALLLVRLQRGYVAQLADNLRAGAVVLDESGDTLDALTTRTIWSERTSIDRGALLEEIRAVRERQASERAADAAAAPNAGARAAAAAERQAFLERIEALESGDPARIHGTLQDAAGDTRLVSFAIPLLGRPSLEDEVLKFVRGLEGKAVGQLTDHLVDRDEALEVRRALPRVLELETSPRSIEGLVLGLEDPDAEVRIACARGGARLIGKDASLRLPPGRVYALLERQLALSGSARFPRTRGTREDPVLLDRFEAARVDRRLEHVFTVLALGLGPDLMAATLRSLYSDDAHLRGTALEYLQATLPEGIRAAIWPELPGAGRPVGEARPESEIADELLRTAVHLRLEPER